MAEIAIAKIDPNESCEMKIFQNQRVVLTKSQHFTGMISKINQIETESLTDEDIQTILVHPVNTISIESCPVSYHDAVLQRHMVYLGLPDGPIGIDLVPINYEGACGGLRVTNLSTQNVFMKDDIIISINNIQIEWINVDRAVELLINTTSRILTIVRTAKSEIIETPHPHHPPHSPPHSQRPQPDSHHNHFHPAHYHHHVSPYPIPQSISVARSRSKKYHPRFCLTFYRDYICDVEKRFSTRPSFDYIPSIDSTRCSETK